MYSSNSVHELSSVLMYMYIPVGMYTPIELVHCDLFLSLSLVNVSVFM